MFRFEILLDIAPVAVPPAKQDPANAPVISTKRLRILLAEDNRVNPKLATRLLEREGHSVVLATDGREAVALWQKEAFDLVLMDVQMPEMDGLQATRRIRELEAGSSGHTPIVAMTANAMKGDEEACLEAGMDAYLSKPIQRDRFSALLERMVQGDLPRP